MSQLSQIQAAQENLEDCFAKRMAELEAHLQLTGSSSKDTLAKIADEFRTFRELILGILGVLRKQINECSRLVDLAETRHRRKALLFLGIAESDGEDCAAEVLKIIQKMNLQDVSGFSSCHRIGNMSKDNHRPILVRFSSLDMRSAVWRAKSRLKGSSVSLKEFLTRSRQTVFGRARQHFGMKACWTQDGVILVKTIDTRHKLTSLDELNCLMSKYPKVSSDSKVAGRGGTGGTSSKNPKVNK